VAITYAGLTSKLLEQMKTIEGAATPVNTADKVETRSHTTENIKNKRRSKPAYRKHAYQVKIARIGKRLDRRLLNSSALLEKFWTECVERAAWYESDKECFVAVYMDNRLQLISWHLVSIGSSRNAIVDPLAVFRPALIEGASAIAVFHNHPAGDCAPSIEDCHMTKTLRNGAEILHIRFTEHLVIGDDFFFSFCEAGFPLVISRIESRKYEAPRCEAQHSDG